MTNLKTTLVLAVLAAGLGVAVIVAETMSHTITERGNVALFTFDRDDAVRLVIEFPAFADRPRVTAEKAAGGWKIVEPWEADADGQSVMRAVTVVATLEGTAHWSESDEAMAERAAERIVIRVMTKDGEEHVVRIGELTGTGFRAWARVSSEPGIWEISKGVWDAANREPVEFRDRTLFTVGYFDIDGFEMIREDLSFRLFRHGETWVMESPLEDRGGEVVLYDFLSEITKARAREFLVESATPEDLKRFGLDPPRATVVLHGGEVSSTVSFGKATVDGDGGEEEIWTARRHDKAFIAKVRPAVASRVEIDDPNHFRNRLLVPGAARWEPFFVSVEGTVDGRRVDFRAEKGRFKWELVEPKKRELDVSQEGYWGRYLEWLKGLAAETFVVEEASPETLASDYGLGASAVVLEAGFQRAFPEREGQAPREKKTVRIRLGRILPAQDLCYAKVEGRPNVVSVVASGKRDLKRGWVRFLDRKLIIIEEERVKWVAFTREGKTARWERSETGNRWIVKEPAGGSAPPMELMQAALGLGLKRAQTYLQEVDDPAGLPEDYGLHPPRARLTVCQSVRDPLGGGMEEKTIDLLFGSPGRGESLHAMYGPGQFHRGDLVFLIGRSSYDIFLDLWKDLYE